MHGSNSVSRNFRPSSGYHKTPFKPSYVLVEVTATGCGHCEKFKQKWPSIKEKLGPRVKIVEINQPSVTLDFNKVYPQTLNLFVQWFPTLCLFYSEEWDSKNLVYGDVFNGYISEGKARTNSRLSEINYENINKWLETKGV